MLVASSLLVLSGLAGAAMAQAASQQIAVLPAQLQPAAGAQVQTNANLAGSGIGSETASDAVLEVAQAVFPNLDKEMVMGTLESIDTNELSQEYLVPIALDLMRNFDRFSGASLLNFVENLTGRDILNWVRSTNLSALAKLATDLHVVDLVKGLTGVDVSATIAQLSSMTGDEVLRAVAQTTGDNIVQWLQESGLIAVAQIFGISPEALVEITKSLSGSDMLARIEAFNGKDLIDTIRSLDGPSLVAYVNAELGAALNKLRMQVAQVLGLPEPEVYTGFDLLRSVRALQSFTDRLAGLNPPDLTVLITSFDGARFIEQLKTLSAEDMLQSVVGLLPVLGSQQGASAEILPLGGLIGAISEFMSTFNGTKLLEDIKAIDFEPSVRLLESLMDTPLVKALISVDLAPYLAAVRAFNPAVLVNNVEKLTGADLLQLLEDVGVIEYLSGLQGIDLSVYFHQLMGFEGSKALESVRSFDEQTFVQGANQAAQSINNLRQTIQSAAPAPAVQPVPSRAAVSATPLGRTLVVRPNAVLA